jgi:hypothetical protein
MVGIDFETTFFVNLDLVMIHNPFKGRTAVDGLIIGLQGKVFDYDGAVILKYRFMVLTYKRDLIDGKVLGFLADNGNLAVRFHRFIV